MIRDNVLPSNWWTVNERLFSGGTGDESISRIRAKYALKNILEKSREKEVVVWEVKRPSFELPSFLEGDFTPATDRKRFASDLKSFLHLISDGPSHEKKFWSWLDEEASDEQVARIRSDLIEKLPFANENVASFNPIMLN